MVKTLLMHNADVNVQRPVRVNIQCTTGLSLVFNQHRYVVTPEWESVPGRNNEAKWFEIGTLPAYQEIASICLFFTPTCTFLTICCSDSTMYYWMQDA